MDGAVFWAGYQSAGRGRLEGRRWDAAPGENLLFTILIPKERPILPVTAFPLGVGLAAALTLEGWGLEARLKWPNDVLCQGRKLAGILCETQGQWLSAGMGLNLAQRQFSPDLEKKAGSVAQFLEDPPSMENVLEAFLHHFHRVLSMEDWRSQVEKRLYRRGKELEVELGLPGEGALRRLGRVQGVGPGGELVLREAGGECFSVFSGEVILRGGYDS